MLCFNLVLLVRLLMGIILSLGLDLRLVNSLDDVI